MASGEQNLSEAVRQQNREEAELEMLLASGDGRAVDIVRTHRVLSQAAFNDVVRENVEEFDMELDAAITDARQQFEQQGVNLSMVNMDREHFVNESKD